MLFLVCLLAVPDAGSVMTFSTVICTIESSEQLFDFVRRHPHFKHDEHEILVALISEKIINVIQDHNGKLSYAIANSKGGTV